MKYDNWGQKTGDEFANEILFAFAGSWKIPTDNVSVKVENGGVTLEGDLNWNFQRDAAKSIAGNCVDVKYVTDRIVIKSESKDNVEKAELEKAFKRSWSLENQHIGVNVTDNKVILTGHVGSWCQKEEAGRIAWGAPGVATVENELAVDYI